MKINKKHKFKPNKYRGTNDERNSKREDLNKIIKGEISITMKGSGFVANEKGDDIEIPAQSVNCALNKDMVEVKLGKKNKFGRLTGEVIKIIDRAKTEFVGTIEKENDLYFLVPDDKKMYKDILINKSPEIKSGLKALIRMSDWTNPNESPRGTLLKIIGEKGNNNAEMESIVLERGFSTSFPVPVENEAKKIKNEETDESRQISKRRDFRKTLTFTIDPVDAKDFDDAISFKDLGNERYEVGVHIADVSHYVRPGSVLDAEARKRQFSVYLVDRTIPMLPEILSNELCSLNPNEDKLSFSAVFILDKNGHVSERWLGKTIIKSAKRFSYESAQEALNNPSLQYHKELTILNSIAKKMQKEKSAKGAIDFEQDEVKFELDENGVPIKIYKKERLDTHKLVEEYMLLANKEVARFMSMDEKGRNTNKLLPFIYRIHDLPDKERIAELSIFLKALGHNLPVNNGHVKAKDLQKLLSRIGDTGEAYLIKTAAVRSMAKAIYSTKNIGHFGLAFDYYTHFTSPIRRYPDLLVHRLLEKKLNNLSIPNYDNVLLSKLATEATEQEIKAAEAERDSKKYKQVQYMQKFIGSEFEGIISGVTEWGMYIEEKNTRAEGMIRLANMDDYYIFDQKNYALIGQKTKKKFALGNKIKFKIVGADLERKSLDYEVVV